MNVLGISGAPPITGVGFVDISPFMFHDSAAAVLRDGRLVAVAEEERLSRIRHTNRFPEKAIQFCLQKARLTLSDIDLFAYYMTETGIDRLLWAIYSRSPSMLKYTNARTLLCEGFAKLGDDDTAERWAFVDHQMCHAACGYHMSGMDNCLVLCLDGVGDSSSGIVVDSNEGALRPLKRFSVEQSLGLYYLQIMRFLGFDQFEEYKVMALASYGRPQIYRKLFDRFYTLEDEGNFAINRADISQHLLDLIHPRRGLKEPRQIHYDVAASLQESIHLIVDHVLSYWCKQTRKSQLCFGGGVAMNSVLNGKLLESNRFSDIYVPPAPHDGGCALGAAALGAAEVTNGRITPSRQSFAPYQGRDLCEPSVGVELARWNEFIHSLPQSGVAETTSQLLELGDVVAWCQDCSEFGPRALGNRSLLADPRVASMRSFINQSVKHREDFRPLAPAVTLEDADRYFDLSATKANFSYMSFVVPVREEIRSLIPAVCHVDGTARVQLVSPTDNPAFWKLLKAFGQLTGHPVLLNTSFNGKNEPIADTIDDAVAAFLTSPIQYLVVGSYLVRKRLYSWKTLCRLVFELAPQVELVKDRDNHFIVQHRRDWRHPLDREVFSICLSADGRMTIDELAGACGCECSKEVLGRIEDLWKMHFVRLLPHTSRDRK